MTIGEHGRNRSGLLRARVEGGQRVTFMELFFDPVLVGGLVHATAREALWLVLAAVAGSGTRR